MKTLYLSDLDGTLLRSDERLSDYTVRVVNKFVGAGGIFSYATARSFVTASRVTAGIDVKIPAICYNGAFIFEDGKILRAHYFSRDIVDAVRRELAARKITPIIYAYIDGEEKFSYEKNFRGDGMKFFLNSREGDPRRREVENADKLWRGDIFYFVCIGDETRHIALSKSVRSVVK